MRVVLTGGGGFIGSHLLARLVGAGMDVTLVGPHAGKSRYTASLIDAGDVRFVRCDGAFMWQGLRPALEDADALVLLGYVMPASSSPAERLADELRRNVAPLVRLLHAAQGAPRHVIFASSVSVYGAPARVPLHESDAARPATAYGVAKLACEDALRFVAATWGWRSCILRYATGYGPGETVPRAIPNFIRAALTGQPPVVNGDGLDEHDYIHVADIVEATVAALRCGAEGVFNVGTGIGTRTIDVARLVLELTGSSPEMVHRAARVDPAGPIRIICDTEAARSQLGFVARRALAEGITEEIGWFRAALAGVAQPAFAVGA